MPEKTYLSKEKYQSLEKELHNLETIRRKEIADKLEYARSLGDLAENAEYHDARNEQAETESRINYLTDLLKRAEIMHANDTEIVEVGNTVTLKRVKDNEKVSYQLVGEEDADITENKISWKSPLGEAMIGKKKGDEFSFKTPKGNVNYAVVDIA